MALNAGLFTYDRRIWVKDAAWENSRWHTISYRAVDEFEYLYIFWKPGVTKTALAAIQEGRRYIGIDKELESTNISRKAAEKYSKAACQMELLMKEAGDGYEQKKA